MIKLKYNFLQAKINRLVIYYNLYLPGYRKCMAIGMPPSKILEPEQDS